MNKILASIVFLVVVFLIGAAPAQLRAEDDFGRLFSSPAERNKLDVLRKNQKLPAASSQQNTPLEPVAAELPQPITMQGYVRRSDGTTTLWVNNKAVQEESMQDDVEIGRLRKPEKSSKEGSESLSVRIPATGKNIRLKAGQVYEPETDRVVELKLLEKEKQLRLEETGTIGGSHAE